MKYAVTAFAIFVAVFSHPGAAGLSCDDLARISRQVEGATSFDELKKILNPDVAKATSPETPEMFFAGKLEAARADAQGAIKKAADERGCTRS